MSQAAEIKKSMERMAKLQEALKNGGALPDDLDEDEGGDGCGEPLEPLEPLDDAESKEAKPEGPLQDWTVGQVQGWLRDLENKLATYPAKFEKLGWSADESKKWSDNMTKQFSSYYTTFKGQSVNGAALSNLSDDDLTEMGVTNRMFRMHMRTLIVAASKS